MRAMVLANVLLGIGTLGFIVGMVSGIYYSDLNYMQVALIGATIQLVGILMSAICRWRQI